MALALLAELDFGVGGSGLPAMGPGWSHPEPGYVWAVDNFSTLTLEVEADHPAYVVVLKVDPIARLQRVAVWTDGHLLSTHRVHRPTEISVSLPRRLVRDGRLVLTLAHYDRVRASELSESDDNRLLSILLRSVRLYGSDRVPTRHAEPERHPLTAEALVSRFQSLGDNCEFGIAQRRFGAEPLNLLRFSATHLTHLLRGLDTEFEGLTLPENLACAYGNEPEGAREYIIQQTSYDLRYHSFEHEGEVAADTVLPRAHQRLRFQLRLFLQDLRAGEKIFVLKRNTPLTLEEVAPVWAALRSYAAHNTLLYVVAADAAHLPGTVEWMAPGLMCGHIDRLAPYDDAQGVSENCWLAICRSAHAMWQDARALLPALAGAA